MQLPPPLQQAIDRALEGVRASDLARAAQALSARYRAETHDGRAHVADPMAARAYLAQRLPATYAATVASLSAAAALRPDFAPVSLLDVGSGPGTALWAAASVWASLSRADLIEASPAMRACGEGLGHPPGVNAVAWRAGDVMAEIEGASHADLVVASYLLGEIAPAMRLRLIDRLWSACSDMVVIVEPGTPAGWMRILQARDRLIAAGAHLVAPCPHHAACPLAAPDWCHFARRLARTRLHRQAKSAEVPWEDEKYIYLAAGRRPGAAIEGRVAAPPQTASGQVRLKLCAADGQAREQRWSRRDGEAFRQARRAAWGDAFPPIAPG